MCNNRIKIHFTFALLLFASFAVFAQAGRNSAWLSDASYINSAAIGLSENVNLTIYHGINGSWQGENLETSSFNFHTPYKQQRFGVGILAYRENDFSTQNSSISIPISYKVNMLHGRLSFGLANGFRFGSIAGRGYNAEHPFDADYLEIANQSNSVHYNFNTGVYYSSKQLYVGASILNLIDKPLQNNYSVPQNETYLLAAKYIVNLNRNLAVETHSQLLVSENANNISLNLLLPHKQIGSGGVGIRTNGDLSILASINSTAFNKYGSSVFELFYIYTTNLKGQSTSFSSMHEIICAFNFSFPERIETIKSRKKIVNPVF